jgi:tetratricopeptide (TPR) repeat protein
MVTNPEVYQQHMNRGHNAAWDQDWDEAIKAYTQAIQELPEDGEAHIHLGLALLRAGRLEDSLRVYKRAHQLSPDDPAPLERSADVLERMGRLKEAAQQYVGVADVYLTLRDLDKAIGNWERATQLTPGLIGIHARLAQAYERVGSKKRALREYLTLAFNFQRSGDTNKAVKAVERALRLDRKNPQALNTLRALRSGGAVAVPQFEDEVEENQSMLEEFGVKVDDPARQQESSASQDGPMGETMEQSLALLADHVASGDLDMASANALQAMEQQRQMQYERAVQAYTSASQSIDHPTLHYNLGVMLHLTGISSDAIPHLQKAQAAPELLTGALHALGLVYREIDDFKNAMKTLLDATRRVDARNYEDDPSMLDHLGSAYDQIEAALMDAPGDAMDAISGRMSDMLSGTEWQQRVDTTRKHVEEIMRVQGPQGVRDFYSTGGSDKLATTVSRIDTYIGQGLLTLAMDESHEAISVSPYYLPIHVRMAEIMMREGRLRQAINKYNTIARAYMSRNELDRAASILSEVLEMAPLDVNVRTSLINLLEGEGRMEDALVQYVDLGRTYSQLGNIDQARETFQYAERLARRNEASPERMAEIKHNLADIEQMRLETRRAMKIYEEILEVSPTDERACRMLVDLNYNQSNKADGLRYLDRLLGLYARRKQVSKIIQVLEDLVKSYPKETGLRSRLAAIYRQTGRRVDAIQQLDALGEIQLEAGLHDDARQTIKQIIRLKPENLNDYKRLLSQLIKQPSAPDDN